MRIDLFRMERTQCLYENEVEFNLSESGVLPMQVREILGSQDDAWLREARIKYPASRGSERLRDRIALFYGSATRDNVMVTNGGSEANYVVFWGMLEKGDRAAIMIPNYLQTWGLARAYAGHADPFRLVERRDGGRTRWALDERSLERAVTRRTKLILVTNPNNPTGAVLNEDEMDAIVRAARRVNAWIVADEVYRGAEVSGPTSPTFWGRHDRVLITAGLRWIHSHDDIFTYVPPIAGAIAMVGYRLPIGSVALFDRLRLEQSVLITPGAHFGIGRYIRIGYGYDPGYLLKGLARVDVTLAGLQRGRAGAPVIRATGGRAGARATRRGARAVAGE